MWRWKFGKKLLETVHKKSNDIHCKKCKRKRLSLIKLSRDREIRERVQLKSTATTAGIHQFGILQLKIANARRRWGHSQRAEESRKKRNERNQSSRDFGNRQQRKLKFQISCFLFCCYALDGLTRQCRVSFDLKIIVE